MATLKDVKEIVDRLDEFRQRNAGIVVAIHKLPQAMDRRNEIEKEVRKLFFNLRSQICLDNSLPSNTPIGKMSDGCVISQEAEKKMRALVGYLDWRQSC